MMNDVGVTTDSHMSRNASKPFTLCARAATAIRICISVSDRAPCKLATSCVALFVAGSVLGGCGGVRGTSRPLLQEKPAQVIGVDTSVQSAPDAAATTATRNERE
jgi:hypothetical protein